MSGIVPDAKHDIMTQPAPHHTIHDHAPFERMAVIRIVVAILGAAALWFELWEPCHASA